MKNNQGQCCFSPMKVSLLHFLHSSELTTVGDDDGALGLAALRAELLHLSEDLHAGGNLSEDGVLAIKVGEGIEAKEELGAVGVGRPRVCHADQALAVVLRELVALVLEVFGLLAVAQPVHASAAFARPGRVAALRHEPRLHVVEQVVVVVLDLAQLEEVFAAAQTRGAETR